MFPLGVIINSLSVLLGGIAGALLKDHLPTAIKTELSSVFGICALGMGISAVVLMQNMPAVIFSVIIGTAIGLWIHLGDLISKGGVLMQKPIAKLIGGNKDMEQDAYEALLVTIIVLFCASGTGIYGSIDSGMTGNHTILISKSILDFFTAMIFACQLGAVVSVISIPQCIIFLILFYGAGVIFPLTTPEMIADFKACGGFLLLATGFRMLNLKKLPTADMIPAMVIVMPISWAWVNWIMPLL